MGGIPAGRRNRLVSLVRYGVTYDDHNQPTEAWTVVEADLWASWRRATANEQLSSGQVGAQVTDIFELVWTPSVAASDPKDGLLFDGRTYDIVEVTEMGFREGLLVRAAAKADGKP